MRPQTLSFSVRLPILALLLCYMALASLATISYGGMRRIASHGGGIRLRDQGRTVVVHRKDFVFASITGAGAFAGHAVQSINYPGVITEAVVSVAMRSWPDSWRPAKFGKTTDGLLSWRGLSFPVYCLPFWWFAGLGLDAFLKRRRLHWSVLLLGTLMAGIFAFLGTCLSIATEPRDYREMAFVFTGFLLWTALLSSFPVTWWRNFRKDRKFLSQIEPA